MRGALCAALWLLAALRPLPAALPAPAPAVAAVGAYGAVATPAVPTVGKGHAAAAPTAPAAGPGCAAALLDDDPAQQELPLEEYMQDDWRDFFAEQPFSLGELRGKSFGEICAAVWAHGN